MAKDSAWGSQWARGDEWQSYPPILLGSTGISHADLIDEMDDTVTPSAPVLDGGRGAALDGSMRITSSAPSATLSPFTGGSAVDTSARAIAADSTTPLREKLTRLREAKRVAQAIVPRASANVVSYGEEPSSIPIKYVPTRASTFKPRAHACART